MGKINETDYSINAGFIYSQFKKNWKEIDRDFLINAVQEALESILFDRNIRTVVFDGNNGDYLHDAPNRYLRHLEIIAENPDLFPFPDFFLIPDKGNNKYFSIVFYNENCIVNKNEQDFDLFFALQLFVTDLMGIDDFLNFHLQKSFLNNSKGYRRFLEKILIKYNDFLSKKHEPLIKSFFEDYLPGKNNEKDVKNLVTSGFQEKINDSVPNLKDEIKTGENIESFIKNIEGKENKFCKAMPVKYAIDHFIVFTNKHNKDGKQFLTIEQFISFLKRAFFTDNSEPQTTLNVGSREKSFVVKRFYEFYTLAIGEFEKTIQCRDKYIKLLADNFTNWSYENLKNNFNNKAKKQW